VIRLRTIFSLAEISFEVQKPHNAIPGGLIMLTQQSIVSLLTRLATATCAIVMFLTLVTAPSLAGGMFEGKKAESPTQNIMKAAEDIANPDKKPMSMEEIQARNKGGLNEIQGNADADKMIDKSQPGKPDSDLVRKMDKEMSKKSK
jgi:hypothetical protein